MEPRLTTAPQLLAVLEELKQREPLFHRPELGTTRRDFENMTDASFWEVGASGRRYSREFVLDTLENRLPHRDVDHWETRGFHCLEIAPENYLVTYTLFQGPRVTRRATLWRRANTGWKVLYHQGTLVDPPA
jgi:hypothetical protein